MRYYPSAWNNYGWSVFYFLTTNITLLAYLLLFIFVSERKRGKYCIDFVTIDFIFTLGLTITTVLQYYKLITYTYGFQIAVFGMIITTVLIVYNALKHGLFNE